MLRRARFSAALPTARSTAFAVAAVLCATPALGQESEDSPPGLHGQLAGPPMLAVVSVQSQRISVYDAHGNALRSPISSGRQGEFDTPVGTYSVLEKNEEHYSNLYDDAAMPFMQRITWSGVALHQGVLPGYPASHGCVRLPMSFATQLFPLTKVGMRVVITRNHVAPMPISHANLPKPAPVGQTAMVDQAAFQVTGTSRSGSAFEPDVTNWPERQTQLEALRAEWLQKSAEADRFKRDVEDLKAELAQKAKPQAAATKTLKALEKVKKQADDNVARAAAVLAAAKDPKNLKPFEVAKAKAQDAFTAAEDRVKKAEEALNTVTSDKASRRAQAVLRKAEAARVAAVRQAERATRSLEAAQSPQRYKKQEDALARANVVAKAAAEKHAAAQAAFKTVNDALEKTKAELAAATAVMDKAVAVATAAKRKTIPVSMFVSLKTQRLYVRQGHEPVADYPIAIADPQQPIGTHVFTAVDYEAGAQNLRWLTVSPNRRADLEALQSSKKKSRVKAEANPLPAPTDVAAAAAALDRVTIPPEVIERFQTSMWPGASLIISDEGLHKETNNATDFIVLLSGEPQGGIKSRPKPKPVIVQQYAFDSFGLYGSGYKSYGRRPVRVQPPKSIFGFW